MSELLVMALMAPVFGLLMFSRFLLKWLMLQCRRWLFVGWAGSSFDGTLTVKQVYYIVSFGMLPVPLTHMLRRIWLVGKKMKIHSELVFLC